MLPLTYILMDVFQPARVPLGFGIAIALVMLVLWTVSTATRDAIAIGKRLHQIPCANCQFFTGDYHLKCTVRPKQALTEEAIYCSDYLSHNRLI